MDDYLLITTNCLKARAFLEMMMKGKSSQCDLSVTGLLLLLVQGTPNMAVSSHTRRQGLTLTLGLIHRWLRSLIKKVWENRPFVGLVDSPYK